MAKLAYNRGMMQAAQKNTATPSYHTHNEVLSPSLLKPRSHTYTANFGGRLGRRIKSSKGSFQAEVTRVNLA